MLRFGQGDRELTGPENTEYTVRGLTSSATLRYDEEIAKVLQELKIDDQKEEVVLRRSLGLWLATVVLFVKDRRSRDYSYDR